MKASLYLAKRQVLPVLLIVLLALSAQAQVVNISATPNPLTATLEVGGEATESLTISNSGNATLEWSIEGISLNSNSGTVNFFKSPEDDWTLPENQDRISPNIWITLNPEAGWYLFNAATEEGPDAAGEGPPTESISPEGTLWAMGATEEVSPEDYASFTSTLISHFEGPPSGNYIMSLYIPDEERYFDVDFDLGALIYDYEVSYNRTEIGGSLGSAAVSSGSLPAGQSQAIEITFDGTELVNGMHEGQIIFTTNATAGEEFSVPFVLTVTGGTPAISVAEEFSLENTFLGASSTSSLTISNTGTNDLIITDIVSDLGTVTVGTTSLTIPGQASASVDLTFTPEAIEDYEGTITITSNDETSPTVVAIAGSGVESPEISVDKTSLSVSLPYEEGTSEFLTIQNLGASNLIWSATLEIPGSEAVTFEKADYADWTLPENQDQITPSVSITRKQKQGIFNILQEGGFSEYSPAGTEWGWGPTAENIEYDDYDPWLYMVEEYPPYIVDEIVSMKSIKENRYFDIEFHSWTQGDGEGNGGGGGFSYTRKEVPGWSYLSSYQGETSFESIDEIEIFFMANRFAGTYQANLVLTSNDINTPEIIIPVTLEVTGTPEIYVEETNYDFGEVFVGKSASQKIEIENTGSADLTISGITTNNDVFSFSETALTIAPNSSETIEVTFGPTAAGDTSAIVSIASNDEENPMATINLSGSSETAPKISATFNPITVDAGSSEIVIENITIENLEGSNLNWGFSSNAYKSLSQALENLNLNYQSILDTIPEMAVFDYDGENYINDGTDDMYDDGNFLGTNLSENIPYSDNLLINGSKYFGAGTSYFTRHLEGLFVLGTELNGVNEFEISGELGADGNGEVDATILEVEFGGQTFQGFVKRVYEADGDPSVNHLIIIPKVATAKQEYATDTDDDYHLIEGINGANYLYYLLYAGYGESNDYNGTYINNDSTLAIMTTFLKAISGVPGYVSTSPSSGSLMAGNTENVEIAINPDDIPEGISSQDLILGSNDPDNSSIVIPITILNNVFPHISISTDTIEFGHAYVGLGKTDSIEVINTGSAQLEVALSINNTAFSLSNESLLLEAQESSYISVLFNPLADGDTSGVITITSNDVDNPILEVFVDGNASTYPQIVVNPEELRVELFPGQTYNGQMTIENLQGIDLDWKVSKKSDELTLENVLDKLNEDYTTITDVIPNRYDFTYDLNEEYPWDMIQTGGNDMFYQGNVIRTNKIGEYPGMYYSDNTIGNTGNAFGNDGRYFTRHLPGLFILAADMDDVSYFGTTNWGDLGADGDGTADELVLEVEIDDITYQGYVKRVYGATTPSVNHIFIVEKNDNIVHDIDTYTGSDEHIIENLNDNDRLYYLLYSSIDGGFIDDDATELIMTTFLNTISASEVPEYISMSQTEGSTVAGNTTTIDISIAADDVPESRVKIDLVVSSNDPTNPKVILPFDIQVSNIVIDNDINDVVMNEGFISHTIDLSNVFLDAEGDPLSFSAASSKESVVTVSELEGMLTITEVGIGTSTISVAATDGENTAYANFSFRVNAIPAVASPIADQSFENAFGSAVIDLVSVFTDADATDVLSFTAGVSTTGVVGTSISGSKLTLTEAGPGTITVTVTASDEFGGSVSDEFEVFVDKIAQTITFDAMATMTYGDPSFDLAATTTSDLTISYESSDLTVATVSGTTVTIVGAGTTTITASQAGDAAYHAAESVMQELTIEKAVITATAIDTTINAGDELPTYTVSYEGFVYDDSAAVIDTAPVGAVDITSTTAIGEYAITLAGGEDNSYTFVYEAGVLTIVEAPLGSFDQSQLHFYPNPSVDFINIVSGDVSTVEVYDLKGTLVLKTAGERTVNIQSLSIGIYTIHMLDSNSRNLYSGRLIKK